MIIYSIFVPHSPILLPTIGKDNVSKLQKTIDAMKEVESLLYATKPDVLVVISPHSENISDRFVLNLSEQYETDFSTFGDYSTKLAFSPSSELILRLKETMESKNVPVHFVSQPKVDYGIGVPLWYLSSHLPRVLLVPLNVSKADKKTHFQFGQILQKEFQKTNERIAIIASGDLSHNDHADKKSKDNQSFDTKILEYIRLGNIDAILHYSSNVPECSLLPLSLLYGIIDSLRYRSHILSYEAPFGVGQAVVHFDFV